MKIKGNNVHFLILLVLVMASIVQALSTTLAALWPSSWLPRLLTAGSSTTTRQEGAVRSLVDDLISHVPESATRVHLIVLVHGWMGNPQEMRYLQTTLQSQAQQITEQQKPLHHNHQDYFIVHSATANDGKTMDGIAAGGSRLAREVNDMVEKIAQQQQQQRQEKQHHKSLITLSFVGNSLGGLYARYALSKIHFDDGKQKHHHHPHHLQPKVFCTTATPHLGVSQHTYIRIPRAIEYLVATAMLPTGRDLFRFSHVIQNMATQTKFVHPLMQFPTRLVYANAYQTDFQVPTATAAFLDPHNTQDANHCFVGGGVVTTMNSQKNKEKKSSSSSMEVLRVQTIQRRKVNDSSVAVDDDDDDDDDDDTEIVLSSSEIAQRLDDIGWTKVFCDVKDHLWSLRVPSFLLSFSNNNNGSSSSSNQLVPLNVPATDNNNDSTTTTNNTSETSSSSSSSSGSSSNKKKKYLTSAQLCTWLGSHQGRLSIPFGHTVMVANSKNEAYAKFNAAGRPLMDQLAAEILHDILHEDDR